MLPEWIRVLDLKSGDPKFKSSSDYQLEFFKAVTLAELLGSICR